MNTPRFKISASIPTAVAAAALAVSSMLPVAASAAEPYIESDGTSGISTGYRMKGTSRLEVDFALTEQTAQARIFGDDAGYETGLKTVLYVSGGADGTFSVEWTRGGTRTEEGHRHSYQAIAVFDFYGCTRESEPSAAETVTSLFNTIASYIPLDAAEMDFFHKNGIKVIYSVKDLHPGMVPAGMKETPAGITSEETASAYVRGLVGALRTHPALLAWYVNDESTIERFGPLLGRKRLLDEIDPDHPTWAVLYQYDMMRAMSPTFDILGVDIYPVPTTPLSDVTDGARKTRDAMLGLRPMWHVPQSFDWGLFRDDKPGAPPYRMPTVDEMRSMAWQFIAAGANGLIFYGFSTIQVPKRKDGTPFSFDRAWADTCAVAAEVRQYIPVLLSAEDAPAVTGAPEAWGVRIWRKDGQVWLLAVNAQDVPSEAELTLGEDFTAVEAAFGPPARQTGPRTLLIQLAPNEPAFYRL